MKKTRINRLWIIIAALVVIGFILADMLLWVSGNTDIIIDFMSNLSAYTMCSVIRFFFGLYLKVKIY